MTEDRSQIMFDCLDFLEANRVEIAQDLKAYAIPYLEHSRVFRGPFLVEYKKDFKNKVESHLKDILIDHFNIDTETATLMLEMAELAGILSYFLKETSYYENH